MGAVPATTCSSAMANSSGLKERPSRTSRRGVVTRYQGSIQTVSAVRSVRTGPVDARAACDWSLRIAQLSHQLCHAGTQCGQVVLYRPPDSFVVYLGVAMDKHVAHG